MKTTRYLIIATLLSVCFTACDLETFDNGDLEGYWKLQAVDTLQTGGMSDLMEKSLFWAVQGNILSVHDNQDVAHGEFVMRFEHKGDSLKLYEPRGYYKQEGDSLLKSAKPIERFGINSLNEGYRIENLTKGHMRLVTEKLRLHFRKF